MSDDASYSRWLGGYAKSVAGSVTAFTNDILEESRHDNQDVGSQLKVANDKITEFEKKFYVQDQEIVKLKSQLLEVADDKEVTELQLQEVGGRWRIILQEKEEELKVLKEKLHELDSVKNTDTVTRARQYSGDLDYSDPFLCEMEITRLTRDNERLESELDDASRMVHSATSDKDNSDLERIKGLQDQLDSMTLEHRNEIALKDQDTEMRKRYETQLQEQRDHSSGEKDRARLMGEIERLMEEMCEVEELYSSTVSENDEIKTELAAVKDTLNANNKDKQNLETKLGKVSENLKRALARLAVKDTKVDELSDLVSVLETELKQYVEQLDFFKNNQTDEIKAAQLGLVSDTVEETPQPTDEEQELSGALSELTEAKQKLSDSESECLKLREKLTDNELKMELLATEVSSVTEASLSTNDTNMLLDQNTTLQKKVTVLANEMESITTQNKELMHQRDFYQDQAEQLHTSMETLRSEANRVIQETSEREMKILADFDRLQAHLVEAEKSHTEEFLDVASTEKGLRSEVTVLREELLVANSAFSGIRAQQADETGSLQEQLHVVSGERDEAVLELSTIEDRAASAETSLSNLQIVLEQFQQNREGYAAEVHDQYRRDLHTLSKKLCAAQQTITRLEARVSEIKLIEEERAECKEDNQLKEKRIKTLQSEVSKLDVALKVAQEGLQKARSTSEDKVERSLIKTFFTQYLTAPENRKPEVLRLMTSILNFSEEDLEQLHKGKDNKWLANFFKPAPNSSPQAPGESFSELFVSFLETEANRGMMGQIPASTPVTQHTRTLSASSNRSIPSNVSSSTESPGTLHHSPIMSAAPMVVPNSLADLLNKTR